MYCDECGKILIIERENARLIGRCYCGFQKYITVEISATQNMPKMEKKGQGFVKDENQLANFPHECKKCSHKEAQVIECGVWHGDEAGVVRYKCGKCGFTEQDKDSNT